jgi:hypothetical protein
MFAFVSQVESPEAVLDQHISVKAAANSSGCRELSRPVSQTSPEKWEARGCEDRPGLARQVGFAGNVSAEWPDGSGSTIRSQKA